MKTKILTALLGIIFCSTAVKSVAQNTGAINDALNTIRFNAVLKSHTGNYTYNLLYSDSKLSLSMMVEKLSRMNDEKTVIINNLLKGIEKIETILNAEKEAIHEKIACPADNLQRLNFSDTCLEQNTPNPFITATNISYTLPQKFTTAQIIISDENGKTLKLINLSDKSRRTIQVYASELAPAGYTGIFKYSLVIDGKSVKSKQMMMGDYYVDYK